jgi:phenylalanyl-tRNA synthetase beta chain
MPAEGHRPNSYLELRNRIKRLMNGFGFTEAITYSFVSELTGDRLRLKEKDARQDFLHILNPLTEDQTVMRTSLVPGLIDAAVYNIARQVKNLKLFEIGKIFIKSDRQELPLEPEILAALWTGSRNETSWHQEEIPCDFYDIKGCVEALIRALKIDKVRFTKIPDGDCDHTRPGYTAQILIAGQKVGLAGEIHPLVRDNFDLKQTAFIFELELDKIESLIPRAVTARPIPRFPAIYRDITIIIDRGIETLTVLEAVDEIGEDLVERLHLFDVFEGDPIAAGKKSVSFRVTYRSSNKTLEDDDVNDLQRAITDKLIKTFGATLP